MDVRKMLFAALFAAALPAAAGERIPIVDEGGIAGQWTAVAGAQLMPPYPPAYAGNPDEVCLVVGYLVNADGSTSDFSLLKSWASGGNRRDRDGFWEEFGDLASRALAQWRYVPRDAASAEPIAKTRPCCNVVSRSSRNVAGSEASPAAWSRYR